MPTGGPGQLDTPRREPKVQAELFVVGTDGRPFGVADEEGDPMPPIK
jgi:hypothetical protein